MIKNIFIKIILFYKKYLTYFFRTSCIFTPTCSSYALEALKKRNCIVAIFLIIWRILRCNPLNKGGFDPVPDSFSQKKWLL